MLYASTTPKPFGAWGYESGVYVASLVTCILCTRLTLSRGICDVPRKLLLDASGVLAYASVAWFGLLHASKLLRTAILARKGRPQVCGVYVAGLYTCTVQG